MELSELNQLKVLKIFKEGRRASCVCLLTGDIVRKSYDSKLSKRQEWFKLEIKILKHLEHCPFVPKLLAVDKKNLTYYMTYCGQRPLMTPENREKNSVAAKSLHRDWNLLRVDKNGDPQYKIYFGNCAMIKDKMFIIDFGSDKWKIVGPKHIL